MPIQYDAYDGKEKYHVHENLKDRGALDLMKAYSRALYGDPKYPRKFLEELVLPE